MPLYVSQLLLRLIQYYHYLVKQIKDLESQFERRLDEDQVGKRLLSIPCVGMLTASTISTKIGDGKQWAVVEILQRQQGWFPGSTAPAAERHSCVSASEAIKRSEPRWFNVLSPFSQY